MFRKKLFCLLVTLILASASDVFAQAQKLRVAITGPAALQPGSNVTYTVTVTNVSTVTVTGVWIYMHFDTSNQALEYLADQNPGCKVIPNNPTWAICPINQDTVLSPNQSKQYFVTYRVPDNLACNSSVVAVSDVRGNNTDPHWSTLSLKVNCPSVPPVLPTLDCVYNLGNGAYRAYFGYNNTGTQNVTLAAGTNTAYEVNAFSPGALNRGQPSTFTPGNKVGVFSVDFNGDPLTWVIKPRFNEAKSITASKNSKACFPIKPIAECRNLQTGGQYLTSYGYQNDNPFPVTLAVPQYNKFSPAPENRGQPQTFASGRVSKVVSILAPTGLTWTIGGLSATSDTSLPQCVQDLGPLCKVVGASNNNCGGNVTNISLDASQSKDPEGKALTYQWITDCANSSFSNSASAKPTLSVTTGGLGVTCGVRLLVNDGINTSTPCVFNINVNTCTFDCLGKPNGTAVKDRCGVCEGNGQSCLQCDQVDTTDTKFALDIGVASQKRMITKIAHRLKAASKNDPKYQALITSSLKDAEAQYRQAWTVAWTSFPTVIESCDNTQFCTRTDYATVLDVYASSSKRLKSIALKLLKQLAKLRGPNDIREKNNDKKLVQQVNDQEASNAATLTTVPRFSSQCS